MRGGEVTVFELRGKGRKEMRKMDERKHREMKDDLNEHLSSKSDKK
jgi:hypothetical protein